MSQFFVEGMPKQGPKSGFKKFMRGVGLTIALVISVLVIVLAWVNVVPAGTNLLTLIGSMAWAIVGPGLVAASLIVILFVSWLFVRSRTKLVTGVFILAIVALLSSVYIVTTITISVKKAGGSVNPFMTLVPKPQAALPDATETYRTVEGKDLHALVYKPSTVTSDTPVLLYVHGGGWVSGAAEQYNSDMRWYASQGMLAVNVEYRLATTSEPTWDKAPADVACAFTWAMQHAKSMGTTSSKFIVMGDSAGGNLVLQVAYAAAAGKAPTECTDKGAVPVPSAVIAGYPMANPAYLYDHGKTWLFGYTGKGSFNLYAGGTKEQYPDRLAYISPLTYVTPSAPRTFIIQPKRDDFIPAEGNYEFAEAVRKAGVTVSVVTIPFTHHGFDSVVGSFGNATKRSIVLHYLSQQGYIQ